MSSHQNNSVLPLKQWSFTLSLLADRSIGKQISQIYKETGSIIKVYETRGISEARLKFRCESPNRARKRLLKYIACDKKKKKSEAPLSDARECSLSLSNILNRKFDLSLSSEIWHVFDLGPQKTGRKVDILEKSNQQDRRRRERARAYLHEKERRSQKELRKSKVYECRQKTAT